MHGEENRNTAGTLLEPWNPAETLLVPCWNCAENLLGPCGKLAATLQEPCAGISVETLAGVVFVFVCFVLLWFMCRVVMLEVWLELCWNRFAALPEPIWRQLLDFLWVLFCSFFFLKCFLLCFMCWVASGWGEQGRQLQVINSGSARTWNPGILEPWSWMETCILEIVVQPWNLALWHSGELWNPVIRELWNLNLGALTPWNPATLEPCPSTLELCPATLQTWNRATSEFCNPGALQSLLTLHAANPQVLNWNLEFWDSHSMDPLVHGILEPWSVGTMKL